MSEVPSFREFCAKRASWWDRLRCRLFRRHIPAGWASEDARFCWRCGAEVDSVGKAVSR